MSHEIKWSSGVQRLLPILSLGLFVAALIVLHNALHHYHYQHILGRFKALPASRFTAALGLTSLSYLVLTLYDRLALVYIQRPLGAGKTILTSFISYAFSNTIGFSLLTGGSIRYRLYSAWGFSTDEIARLYTFTVLTFWLGIATVAGITFVVEPMALPVLQFISINSVKPVGVIFILCVIGYLVAASRRKTPFQLRNWEIPMPSERLALSQVFIGSLDWCLAASVLYVLLPEQAVRLAGRWWGILVPQLLAAATLVSGAILLISGATPAVPERLHWLSEIFPLPVIELSHFLGSLVGVCLLLLAHGLQRRLDAAYVMATFLLGAGSLLSILKGADYEEAVLLALMLLALLPCRKHFYRQSSLLSDSFSLGWSVTILVVFGTAIWLGLFAYKHVGYSSQLWWQFTLHGDAPRFLRGAVGASSLLLVLAIARLLRPATADPAKPVTDELDKAREIITQSAETQVNLALLGDKALLFDNDARGFVMYGVEGHSWIALGDPAGPRELARDLVWEFRELAERHGGRTVFYEVGTSMLHVYLDMGLSIFKIGEQATVSLPEFSLKGHKRSDLRYIHRRLGREGCSFEVLPISQIPGVLPELRTISDAWLKDKNTREKGFSLGSFEEGYIKNFPAAVVRLQGEIVAFANIWEGADKRELSLDLMRFSSQAPKGVMDYLFICLMLWGQEHGYQTFDLGMAPLSGLENRPFAPLWNRIGAVVFRHGEHFYNFDGLRSYKNKFTPTWEPRYITCAGGFALPRILITITSLISRGIKGVVAK